MRVLAVETATEACSAALLTDSGVLTRFEYAPRLHTRLILPMIESLLDEAGLKLTEIDALAFGRGPGAFTGLRIAAGIAQGLALSVDVPVVPVSTLAALALQAVCETGDQQTGLPVIATLDARMGEIYCGRFKQTQPIQSKPTSYYGMCDGDFVKLEERESLLKPQQLATLVESEEDLQHGFIAIGSGWDAYQEAFNDVLKASKVYFIPDVLPAAHFVALQAKHEFAAGNTVTPELAQPIYIRDKVAKKTVLE